MRTHNHLIVHVTHGPHALTHIAVYTGSRALWRSSLTLVAWWLQAASSPFRPGRVLSSRQARPGFTAASGGGVTHTSPSETRSFLTEKLNRSRVRFRRKAHTSPMEQQSARCNICMARVYLEHVREKTGSEFPPKSPWWAWALRHAAWDYNRFHVRADTRVTPYSKIRLKTYAQTQLVYGCWLVRDSHRRTHCWKQSWGFPHANGQETDRGQELVDRGCCRHGVDAVEDRGDDARQTTNGWRHCQRCSVPTENHNRDPQHRMPKACRTNQRNRRYHSGTQTMKLQNAPRWRWRAHQCRTQGAHHHHHRLLL